jgi:hypothetical protein
VVPAIRKKNGKIQKFRYFDSAPSPTINMMWLRLRNTDLYETNLDYLIRIEDPVSAIKGTCRCPGAVSVGGIVLAPVIPALKGIVTNRLSML